MESIALEFNELYQPIFRTRARYIDLWGGRGRGASFTATQYFLHLLLKPDYFRGYLMREIATDIRESLWRDLKDRIVEADLEEQFNINESLMTLTHLHTGNTVLSKGFKKSAGNRTAKLKSIAGATHVIIEEAEEVSENDFLQLDDSLRTVKGDIKIFKLFNPPPKRHWFWNRWYNLTDFPDTHANAGYFKATPKRDPNLLSIFSTYRDNVQNLNQSFLDNLLLYKGDHLQVIVNGLISEGSIGRIYKNWKVIHKMPNYYTKFYGLDWGFNDPVAVTEMETHNRQLWIQQKVYQRGLTNDQLSILMEQRGMKKSSRIFADSANPKDIEDLKKKGWNIVGARKGPGSVQSGIKHIQQYEVFVTEDSKDIWMENENYSWALDQFKLPTDEPIDAFNHAMDSINYGMDYVKMPAGIRVL